MVRACARSAIAVTAWHPGRLAIGRLDDSVASVVALRCHEDRPVIANPAIAHASSGDAESPGAWSAA
jgi:hypothetical protein